VNDGGEEWFDEDGDGDEDEDEDEDATEGGEHNIYISDCLQNQYTTLLTTRG